MRSRPKIAAAYRFPCCNSVDSRFQSNRMSFHANSTGQLAMTGLKVSTYAARWLLPMWALLFCGCRPAPPAVQPREWLLPADAGPAAEDYPHLHNLMQVTGRIYAGSEPHGEAAFAELKKLGVKTVVSVDGARPQTELAAKHGLRYVHIPIGYDGVPDEAGKSLARVMQEAEGPIYFHCHHGKHRGPAAAAVACVASGAADGEGALEILRRAGTSEGYAGLWRDVEDFHPPAADEELPELVAVAEVGSMAAAMAQIDRAKDNLALANEARWSAIAEHPDIVAAQEAIILREALHETGRHLAGDYDQAFANLLAESEAIAIELEAAIKSGQHEAADRHFDKLITSCKTCHVKYRD
jgi:protein tyrosine phosphatase (PTP) superfamily phosphohydrolase (DUF442 family)